MTAGGSAVGNTKRTALYGGAFDPLHNGHLATIATLLNSGAVDEVLVIPSGDRPDKPACTPASVRYEMCSIALADAFPGDPRVVLSDLHSGKRVGYATIDLVRYFGSDSGREVFVVVGEELLSDLHTWKEAEALKHEGRFMVVHRPGVTRVAVPDGWSVAMLPSNSASGVDVSSTVLRAMIRDKRSCAGLMPACIERFCKERGLYI